MVKRTPCTNTRINVNLFLCNHLMLQQLRKHSRIHTQRNAENRTYQHHDYVKSWWFNSYISCILCVHGKDDFEVIVNTNHRSQNCNNSQCNMSIFNGF